MATKVTTTIVLNRDLEAEAEAEARGEETTTAIEGSRMIGLIDPRGTMTTM